MHKFNKEYAQEKKLICLLDKEFPPEHSFVDGMLCSLKLRKEGVSPILITSRGLEKKNVARYRDTLVLPILKSRKGINRFLNLFIVLSLLKKLVKKYKRKKYDIVLFIRNEPTYLLASMMLNTKFDAIVFQSSFPHEKGSENIIKREITKGIFRLSKSYVSAILAVSPLGLKRLEGYFGNGKISTYIPLLNSQGDFLKEGKGGGEERSDEKKISFIYIGTHAPIRKLDVILQAIVKAENIHEMTKFTFIGGSKAEYRELTENPNVKSLEKQGVLIFKEKIPRDELIYNLPNYDVGICFIPPNPIYKEASPTKLVEYMGAGLAVLASNGIELQEKFVKESNCGFLIDWDEKEMIEAIEKIVLDRDKLDTYKNNAFNYAQNNLTYEKYIADFLSLLK